MLLSAGAPNDMSGGHVPIRVADEKSGQGGTLFLGRIEEVHQIGAAHRAHSLRELLPEDH